jgi:pantoate--beta-alanine ligase
MQILETTARMKDWVREAKSRGESLGLVPTMGFLHEGHLSLVRAAVGAVERTVTSIFVNPAQFAPHEDFADYPRDMERDLELLRDEKVDVVFTPPLSELYPEGYSTYVEVHDLQDRLCGKSRPIFFRGVCTVVLKLFHIIEPDVAYFGQKDAQQSIIIRRMVKDLDLDTRIEICPIVRDSDGLALSSRNAYLDEPQREAALCLYRSLEAARAGFKGGERDAARLISAMKREIQAEPRAKIDYVEIVDTERLLPRETARDGDLMALAVFIDDVRLIDNLLL